MSPAMMSRSEPGAKVSVMPVKETGWGVEPGKNPNALTGAEVRLSVPCPSCA